MAIHDPAEEAGRALLARAERAAERDAAIARLAISLVLIVVIQIILWDGIEAPEMPVQAQVTLHQVRHARIFLIWLFLIGLFSYIAVQKAWGTRWRPFVTTAADGALILGNIAHTLWYAALPGGLVSALPVVFAIPIIIGGVAIHYRPALQIFATAIYGLGLIAIVGALGVGSIPERADALQNAVLMFGLAPNVVRLVMFGLFGALLVLVAIRGRALLRRAIKETVRRSTMSRFLPGEISRLVGTPAGASLREGRRQVATVVFVDIRDSTGRAETLDPRALSVFISAFRRRVMRAAADHGGVVDKFVGDGALIVFGVPEPKPDDAARALAFGAGLLNLIERWNIKRRFDPPVRVGIGVHTGEVYCGLVGDESRLEFTVLGDAVNVAARLEDATKIHGVPMLASEATIEAACADGWREVANETLRGRIEATRILTLVG